MLTTFRVKCVKNIQDTTLHPVSRLSHNSTLCASRMNVLHRMQLYAIVATILQVKRSFGVAHALISCTSFVRLPRSPLVEENQPYHTLRGGLMCDEGCCHVTPEACCELFFALDCMRTSPTIRVRCTSKRSVRASATNDERNVAPGDHITQ